MNDLIRRKDVEQMLTALGGCDASDKEAAGWDKAIDAALHGLGKVESTDGRISCSDGLPILDLDVEVTITTPEGKYVYPGLAYYDGVYWRTVREERIIKYRVLAWKPKTKPWEGEYK